MTRIEKSIEIDASPEDVWTAILPENMPQWFEPFKEVALDLSGDAFRVSSDIADNRSRWDAVIT